MPHGSGRLDGSRRVSSAAGRRQDTVGHRLMGGLLGIAATAVLCVVIGGCGGGSGGIAGKYSLETDPTHQYLMLRADGSYEMKYKGIGSTDVSTYTGKWRRNGEQLLLLCGLLNGYDFCDPNSPPTMTGTLKGGRYVVKIWPELLGPEVWVKQ